MHTEDIIAEIERRIKEKKISWDDQACYEIGIEIYGATKELESLLDWIKSKQLNTTKNEHT